MRSSTPSNASTKVLCPSCDGTGEIHSHNPLCRTCHGTGRATPEAAKAHLDSEASINKHIPNRSHLF